MPTFPNLFISSFCIMKNSNLLGLSENSLCYHRQYLALLVAVKNSTGHICGSAFKWSEGHTGF
jgi:hypothetical protein